METVVNALTWPVADLGLALYAQSPQNAQFGCRCHITSLHACGNYISPCSPRPAEQTFTSATDHFLITHKRLTTTICHTGEGNAVVETARSCPQSCSTQGHIVMSNRSSHHDLVSYLACCPQHWLYQVVQHDCGHCVQTEVQWHQLGCQLRSLLQP